MESIGNEENCSNFREDQRDIQESDDPVANEADHVDGELARREIPEDGVNFAKFGEDLYGAIRDILGPIELTNMKHVSTDWRKCYGNLGQRVMATDHEGELW